MVSTDDEEIALINFGATATEVIKIQMIIHNFDVVEEWYYNINYLIRHLVLLVASTLCTLQQQTSGRKHKVSWHNFDSVYYLCLFWISNLKTSKGNNNNKVVFNPEFSP
jgi:hypothetical protein